MWTRPSAELDAIIIVSTGGRGRLRVLRQAAAGDAVLGAQLLRRIRQCRRHDDGGLVADVLVPGKWEFGVWGLWCVGVFNEFADYKT